MNIEDADITVTYLRGKKDGWDEALEIIKNELLPELNITKKQLEDIKKMRGKKF